MAQTWFAGIQSLLPFTPQQDPALKWSGANGTNWNTTDTNWAFRISGNATTYVDDNPGSDVVFDDSLTANPAITLNTTVTPVAVTFANATNDYTISGPGNISGPVGLVKNNTGIVTLNTSNTFTGNVTVNLGTLVLNGVNGFGNTSLSSNAVVRASKTGALGFGTIIFGGAQTNSCRIELTGGITVTNALTLRSRNFPLGFPAHFLNVTGTNIVNPPGDVVLPGGGNVITLQSDTGLLVLTKGMTTSASAPRYLALQGAGNGEVQGGISANGALAKLGTGTWTMSGISPMNGPTLISNGVLVVNGNFTSAANAVTNAGGTLAGNGIIAGPVRIQSGSTLAPGLSVGKLTINNTLTLQGTTVMEIARNGSAVTNDLVTGITTVNYGGTLLVTNVGSSPLQVGDSFQLFNAAVRAGVFTSIIFPGGYTFTNNLALNGTIAVLTVPPPAPPNFPPGAVNRLPDGKISLTVTGSVGSAYRLWASTNLGLKPVTNTWTLLTNSTITTSPFTIIDNTATNLAQRFYLFSTP